MKGDKRRWEPGRGFSEEPLENILFNDAIVPGQQRFDHTQRREKESHGGRSCAQEPPDEVLLATDYETEVKWTSSKTRRDEDVTEHKGGINQAFGFECDELPPPREWQFRGEDMGHDIRVHRRMS